MAEDTASGVSRMTYDWNIPGEPPVAGDVLVSMSRRTGQPTGTCYVITSARVVNQRDPVPGLVRMAYRVERVELWSWDAAVRAETLVWGSRERT